MLGGLPDFEAGGSQKAISNGIQWTNEALKTSSLSLFLLSDLISNRGMPVNLGSRTESELNTFLEAGDPLSLNLTLL